MALLSFHCQNYKAGALTGIDGHNRRLHKPSGNHAIRKTFISELHDSQLLPDIMITKFAGHKNISTTQKHYIHTVKSLDTKADVFAKVLGTKAM